MKIKIPCEHAEILVNYLSRDFGISRGLGDPETVALRQLRNRLLERLGREPEYVEYIVSLRHDSGRIDIRVADNSIDSAIDRVLKSENAPRSAFIMAQVADN